jgi:uncharacterized membrane protein
MLGRVSSVLAALLAAFLVPDAAGAFIIGATGSPAGADLLHLKQIEVAGAAVACIGGAGTFDGLVVSGIIAAYLA